MAEFEQNSPIVLVPLIKPAFHDMAKTANMEKGVFYSTLVNILNLWRLVENWTKGKTELWCVDVGALAGARSR